jgi:hypothetical protein
VVADVLETTIAGGEGRRLGARAEPAFVALLEIQRLHASPATP